MLVGNLVRRVCWCDFYACLRSLGCASDTATAREAQWRFSDLRLGYRKHFLSKTVLETTKFSSSRSVI
jgi:hypothetical protein